MIAPIQKVLAGRWWGPRWMGVVLATFEGQVYPINGTSRELTRRVMAELLECSEETVENYIEQNTTMGSDKLALFFARFPGPVVEFANRYLDGLRLGPTASREAFDLAVRVMRPLQTIVELAAAVPAFIADGHLDQSEKGRVLTLTARARSELNDVDGVCHGPSKPANAHAIATAANGTHSI